MNNCIVCVLLTETGLFGNMKTKEFYLDTLCLKYLGNKYVQIFSVGSCIHA